MKLEGDAMRVFGIIGQSIWASKKFNKLKTDAAKLFYIYAHTCRHGNAAGCYYLPLEYVQKDMEKTKKEIDLIVEDCLKVGLVNYDFEIEFIRIRKFYLYNKIAKTKHAMGAVKNAIHLNDSILKSEVLEDLLQQKNIITDIKLSSQVEQELMRLSILYPSDMGMIGVSNTETKTQTKTKTEMKTNNNTMASQGGVSKKYLNTNFLKS